MIRTFADCPDRGAQTSCELSNYETPGVPPYEKKCICTHPEGEGWFCENLVTYGLTGRISKCPRGFVR